MKKNAFFLKFLLTMMRILSYKFSRGGEDWNFGSIRSSFYSPMCGGHQMSAMSKVGVHLIQGFIQACIRFV